MGYLDENGYIKVETCQYPNGSKSEYYVKDKTAIIVDYDICKCESKEEAFPYSLITDKQNSYMKSYDNVYRTLSEDLESVSSYISTPLDIDGLHYSIHTADRGDSADASPLEFLFERSFANVYGADSVKYLWKEYCISDFKGNNFFLDYHLKTPKGNIAIEENGVTYHHPQVIGKEKYKRQLNKQNLCTKWGIKLYRFSTEDCQFEHYDKIT